MTLAIDGVEDCAAPENPEVLRRISVIPNWYWMDLNSTYGEYVSERYKLFQDYKVHGQDADANNNPNKVVRNSRKYVNTTDFNDIGNMDKTGDSIGTLKLETNEVAVFTMDLTGLPNNMTYEDHYRISIYVDCMPCPNRYQCLYDEGPKGKCDNPDDLRQWENFNRCLQRETKTVCVTNTTLTAELGDTETGGCLYFKAMYDSGYYPLTHPNTLKDSGIPGSIR